MIVRQATIDDLDGLVPLFDAYRQFYGQSSDKASARAFLTKRFEHQQSVIFGADDGLRLVGLAQLYPSFSSIGLTRGFILNDLFVSEEARGYGTGRTLLDAACDYGRKVSAAWLTLSTAIDNARAQALYEDAGWVRDTQYHGYAITLA